MKSKTLQIGKAMSAALFVLLLNAVGMTKTYAYDFSAVCSTGQTLYYNIIDSTNHYVELTCPGTVGFNGWSGYTEPTGSIILPENVQYDGTTYSVTSIGNCAFCFCSGLTGSLNIPNSVTSIGYYAFSSCWHLTSMFIPSSVTYIATNPFDTCDGLSQIIVDSGNTVYDSRENCNAIIKTSTNELVTGCKNTVIPNSVISIGANAFRQCTSLTSISIPNSVIAIGSDAFEYCGLTSIFIPSSVTYIGTNPFERCSGLSQIIVDSGNTVYDSREDCNAIIKTSTNELVTGCKNTVIPNSVTSIGYRAFYGCGGLKSIVIPNHVTSIGMYAFDDCYNLLSVTFSNSVTTIGHSAFEDCYNIKLITFGNSVASIGPRAFYYSYSPYYLTILAETPPTLDSNYGGVFTNVDKTIPVYVPYGTSEAYMAADGWNEFTNFIEMAPTYTISAESDPIGAGEVSIIMEESTLVCEPFEEYPEGNKIASSAIAAGHDWWTTWGNAPGSSQDGVVANFDNTQCGHLTYGNDLVFLLSDKRNGNYDIEFDILVPNGKNGFFNILHHFGGSNSIWAMQCYLHSTNDGQNTTSTPGHGTIHAGSNNTADLPCVYDAWMHFRLNVDIDNDTARYYYTAPGENEILICEWQWSLDSFGEFVADRTLAALNFYPPINTATSEFYLDNISIKQKSGDVFTNGSNCSLTATPNQGYLFENWTNEGSIVSDSTTYSFIVTEDATFIANFTEQPALDTTIYAEICYGEDYLENGFEIIQPEVGIGNYSMTFHPVYWYDSIVNLTLTVYPTYYFVEDTTLCETIPFYWHGNTYTESGIYYDSLQTIHGCDSIFQLSLEFFNTPLGEFAGMTPTNNYPFTSLPITFSWDAVSGAEYYNLYLWNTDDPVPSTPFAGNIYNRSCYVSSLQNHQTYNWYVEAVNTCFSSTSSVRSFSLNIPPSMNVSTNNLAFGEVVLNDSVSMNMFVSGNALDDAITLQITGEDASMFSFEQGSNWNGLTGGSLTVTFSPTAVQYNYTANLVITTGTLTQTVQLTGSLADMFVFNTYVTQDVFEMNSTIPIYGTVTDVNNSPMAGAEVEVKVKVMGTTRSLFATTGDDGHFSVEFVPAYSESGYYTVNSGRVGHSSTAVHDDFNIPGMNLVTNGWILWDVVQNETTTGSIVIRNRSQIPLTNIQVAATTLPDGCSFTFQPLSLQGMEEGVLEYSVTGSALTSGNNYEEVRLVATSAEGATMNFSAWYYCAEPRGILYAAPNNITTTMTKGNSKIVDVMLYNNGTGPTGSVYLDLPSVDWLSVVGNDTLPSIAVHDSAYFSLRLSANENTPLVQYTGNIAVNCERGDGLSLPYSITAVSDSTGTLVVDVTDDYTYNGNGQHLAGATVTVKGYFSLQTVAIGLTGSDGTFTVEDIPEGYYRMTITAPHHAEYQATIQIEGGQTNTQNIYLQYQAITYSWNVVPTEIEDEYTFELIVEFETNVPAPVVVIDMPQTFPELAEGESFVFDYIITNYGLVDAYETTLYPPTNHPLYDFTPLITEIDTLHAQTSVVIPCTMIVRTGRRSQAVIEALGGNGNREETDCPYSALTKTKQYYICGDQQYWFWANVWRNIGSTPCQMAPVNPSGGGGPGGGGGYGGGGGASSSSSTPAVTVQNNDCDFDPCLSGVKEDIDNCDNNGSGTPPALPPQNPANNR